MEKFWCKKQWIMNSALCAALLFVFILPGAFPVQASEPEKKQAQSNLEIRHELPFYHDRPEGVTDIFEGLGEQLVWAKVDGYDLMFWVAVYFHDGTSPDGVLADDVSSLSNILMIVPQKDRGKMNDNDFIATGFSPTKFYKSTDLKVDQKDDRVIMKLADVEMNCSPPHWRVRGKNELIEYDLKISGSAPTSFYIGDFDDIWNKKNQATSFNQLTTCTGTIKFKGKTYNIGEGYGCHEHVVALSVSREAFKGGMHWFNGGNQDVQFSLIHYGGRPHAYGRVAVEGKYPLYEKYEDITMQVLERWHDPRSQVMVPSKWHINMRSSEGIFDVVATASGRANRPWILRHGIIHDIWILGTMNGSFIYPDGKTVPIKDELFMVEYCEGYWP